MTELRNDFIYFEVHVVVSDISFKPEIFLVIAQGTATPIKLK